MDKQYIAINTLVFLEQLREGVPQVNFIEDMVSLGVGTLEIRREFIKDMDKELAEISQRAKQNNVRLFYSVPELIYKKGELQENEIRKYFEEANKMGSNNVKMNIGEVESIKEDDVRKVNQLCEQYKIQLTVENDQTEENGRMIKIKNFTEEFRKKGGKLGVTFDIGNWIWVGEDPLTNAKELTSLVTYIHLKDVVKEAKPRTVFLNEGIIPWKEILSILPKEVPIALEYNCGSQALEVLAKELDTIFNVNIY